MDKWDARPIKGLEWRGQKIEVFTRSALAIALNRAPVTIRKMEQAGIICTPFLRTDRAKNRGWWCYTRDQIEDLIQLAEEEGVLDPRFHKPFTKRFQEEARRILKRKPNERTFSNG